MSLNSYLGPTNRDAKLMETGISYSRSKSHTIPPKNTRNPSGHSVSSALPHYIVSAGETVLHGYTGSQTALITPKH